MSDYRSGNNNPNQKRPPNNDNKPKNTKSTKTNKENKTNAKFYIITLAIAVFACLIVFAIVFASVIGKGTSTVKDKNIVIVEPTQNESTQDEIVVDTKKFTGIIKSINGNQITLYEAVDEGLITIKVQKNTEIKDVYNKNLVLAELEVGEVVDVVVPSDSLNAISITQNSNGWETTRATGIVNDTTNKTYTYNGKVYSYGTYTHASASSDDFTADDVTPDDVITFRGYKNQIYYVELIKGHGYLAFANTDKVVNGVAEIDTNIIIKLDDNLEQVTLTEGPHKLVVKADNIDPYLQDIMIYNNETLIVDLLTVPEKQSLVTINCNVTDYKVLIDNNEFPTNEPILIPYGQHNFKIIKEGYVPFEQNINVNTPSTIINADLTQKVQLTNVSITTSEPGAYVYIDNAFIGNSPTSSSVEYGNHNILIKMDGYIDVNFPFEAKDKNQSYSFTLMKSDKVIPGIPDVTTIEDTEKIETGKEDNLVGN